MEVVECLVNLCVYVVGVDYLFVVVECDLFF